MFLGHFTGHIRGFVAMSAGSSHFPYGRYLLFEAPAALCWSVLYTALGYYLASNLDLARTVLTRIGLGTATVVGLAALALLVMSRTGLLARLFRATPSGHHA